MPIHSIAVLVGSLRRDSYSGKLAEALRMLAPPSLRFWTLQIGDLPLYNPDLEAEPPRAWTRLRQDIASASGVLVVTPEYNRSMPAALKNAIDVASRPYEGNVFRKLPVSVVSQSPGAIGGFGASQAVRQALAAAGAILLTQPEMYLSRIEAIFDEGGALQGGAADLCENFLEAFADWVPRHAARAA